MIGKNVKRVVSIVLALLMTCQGMVFAKESDYIGHWAEESIQNWVHKGYVKGYPDGTFKPENSITRAEFICLVNRSFEFTEEAEVSYKDVKESHWAYEDFKKASAAGYIGGYEDGTLGPSNNITRQEVATIIARLLNLKEAQNSEAFLELDDFIQVPQWSAGAVSALVDKGYINLREGNLFAPTAPATRAEVIAALDKGYLGFTERIQEDKEIPEDKIIRYDTVGTYTVGIVDGSVEINAKNTVLKDSTINGDLIIGEAIGNGEITLKRIIVKGNTIVKGGGMNSVIIEDSDIKNLIIEKKDGKVRILAKGSTYVDNVDFRSGGKLESRDRNMHNFRDVVIAERLTSREPIILVGNFRNIKMNSGNNEIQIKSGIIKNFEISKTAKDAKVILEKGVKVDRVEINAVAKIEGEGKIGIATANSNGVKIWVPVEGVEEIVKGAGVDKVDTLSPSTVVEYSEPRIKTPEELGLKFDAETGTITDYDENLPLRLVIPTYLKVEGENVKVTAIGERAFFDENEDNEDYCKLNSIVIPNSVESIGEAAFGMCRDLSEVRLGNGLTAIGYAAFAYCTSLESIVIPNSVESIGEAAFVECINLSSVKLGSRLTTIDRVAFAECTSLETIVIPDSVEAIGEGAFKLCEDLSSVKLGDGLTTIGEFAFNGCTSLETIIIPDSVESMGTSVFSGCTNLSDVMLGNGLTKINEYTFSRCSSLESIVIPDSIESIDRGAFSSCTKLLNVKLGSKLAKIDGAAFFECSSLEGIEVPSSVKDIGSEAFRDCIALTNFNLGDGTTIGSGAFSGCEALTVIKFGDDTTISESAFSGCSALTTAELGNGTAINMHTFPDCIALTTIKVGDGTTIGLGAFSGHTKLTTVELGSETTINIGAFAGCTALTTITIGDETNIWPKAFEGCEALTTITIGEEVVIGDSGFTHNFKDLYDTEGSGTYTYYPGNSEWTKNP